MYPLGIDAAHNPLAFPISVGLCLASIAVSLLWWTGSDLSALFMSEEAIGSQPWRLFTSTLPHLDFVHLAFNCYWTWRFGAALEAKFGGLRFAALVLLLAAGSAAAEFAFAAGGVGLSGVGYGLFGFLWVAQRRGEPYAQPLMTGHTAALFVGWFLLCIVTTVMDILPVGNVAHGSGAVLGAIAAVFASSKGAENNVRVAAITTLAGLLVILAGLAGPLRTSANLSGDAGFAIGREGHEAVGAGENQRALELFEQAVELTPDSPSLWYNLALAYRRLERFEDAVKASSKAAELAPAEYQELHGRAYARLGQHLSDNGRHDEALKAFEAALEISPSDVGLQLRVELARQQLQAASSAEPEAD